MLPGLDSLDESQILERLGKPDTSSIKSTDGKALTSNFPPYLVDRVSPGGKYLRESLLNFPMAKIIDFGESFFNDQAPTTLHTPLVVRAPEAIFQDQIDHRVDLWSTGCLVRFILHGLPPRLLTNIFSCLN